MHCFYIKLNSSSIPRAHSQLLTTQHIYTNPLKKQQSINLSKSPLDYAPFRSPPLDRIGDNLTSLPARRTFNAPLIMDYVT